MEWEYIWPVLAATGFTFAMTAAGAAMVFLLGRQLSPALMKAFMGFAGGVMIAASVWSLLLPAIEEAVRQGKSGVLPAAGGFAFGGLFFLVVDFALQRLHREKLEQSAVREKRLSRKTSMLFLAVTLHNIPEGMAVGVAFAMAAEQGLQEVSMVSAIALAIGIGIQNFPEGAAIALPLRQEGLNRRQAFLYGAASGIVEPLAGILTVFAVGMIQPVLPWVLSFAAGAMIYVVVEELVPEAHIESGLKIGTIGALVGFLVMMVLDVALG
ncbi:MAG: ZIP family metal transporter [Lachnospiraceae bacterium]|nr:ZIP family metal transporter [Lachnospiraceae bacterium]